MEILASRKRTRVCTYKNGKGRTIDHRKQKRRLLDNYTARCMAFDVLGVDELFHIVAFVKEPRDLAALSGVNKLLRGVSHRAPPFLAPRTLPTSKWFGEGKPGWTGVECMMNAWRTMSLCFRFEENWGMPVNNITTLSVDVVCRIYLDLHGCRGISDVSALGGVHALNLSGCSGISDVSALGDVHILKLTRCSGISDVSGCLRISDVSALGGVHTLYLIGCVGIRDVSALGKVHTLIK